MLELLNWPLDPTHLTAIAGNCSRRVIGRTANCTLVFGIYFYLFMIGFCFFSRTRLPGKKNLWNHSRKYSQPPRTIQPTETFCFWSNTKNFGCLDGNCTLAFFYRLKSRALHLSLWFLVFFQGTPGKNLGTTAKNIHDLPGPSNTWTFGFGANPIFFWPSICCNCRTGRLIPPTSLPLPAIAVAASLDAPPIQLNFAGHILHVLHRAVYQPHTHTNRHGMSRKWSCNLLVLANGKTDSNGGWVFPLTS